MNHTLESHSSTTDNNICPLTDTQTLVLCQEFASVTNTDINLAKIILQENQWNLERAVSIYFDLKIDESKSSMKRIDSSIPIDNQYENSILSRISVNEWCDIVSRVLDLHLPWRTLKSRLVQTDTDGSIIYESTFRSKELQFTLNVPISERRTSLCQAIYRNKDLLETVFRAIDKDNSGVISMQEFTDVCTSLGHHDGTKLDEKQIMDLAASIDLDKNGVIDFNEFLEAFRIVDIADHSDEEN
ncbi:unnamed protein product [Rotaria sp. Silwood1]|nr:unnamed protein product [Rotaria sp. Silwood1]